MTVNDEEIVNQITKLADEEHQLEQSHAGKGRLSDDQVKRLHDVEVALDQCWDLLRQRRARREVGEDPDGASVRPESTVENYKQ
jgi:hypothetical protein